MTDRPPGKVRSPLTVILLSIVTLGIYSIVYYYCTFEELRNYRGQGWSGLLYLIFQFFFPIPLIGMPWLLPAYVGRLYAEDGQPKPITGLSGFWVFLPILGPFIWLFSWQGRLNEFWERKTKASSLL